MFLLCFNTCVKVGDYLIFILVDICLAKPKRKPLRTLVFGVYLIEVWCSESKLNFVHIKQDLGLNFDLTFIG